MSETLYNGIVLADAWPPRDLDPQADAPMPVPWLAAPPPVIPIDVGRQLLVDDFLVAQTTLERVFHRPVKYPGNPVFKAATPEECARRGTVYLGHGGVFFDPGERVFKMFHNAGWRGPLCLAISPDMINWSRPELAPGQGNALWPRSVDDNSVWLDAAAADPELRLKYLECHRQDAPVRGHCLYTSADGQHWSAGKLAGQADDYCSFFHNPFRNVWGFSIKRGVPGRGRSRYYQETPDFPTGADWSGAVYWTGADRLDAPEPEGSYHPAAHAHGCQLYSLNAVAYESILVGMHYIHRGPDNRTCEAGAFPKLTDLEVGFSRDGFHWHRPDRRGFLRGTRRDGDWDRAYLHSTTGVFVVLGDQLVFPYTGFSGSGADGSRGMYHGGAIGIAALRRDGFASLRAGPEERVLLTRPLLFHGAHLFVNVDNPHGVLAVEVLDEQGRPLPGYARADCLPLSVDCTKTPVRWRSDDSLARFAGRPVRFRFHLREGDLHAFWVSRSPDGASGGYVAGGGAAFTSNRDV